MKKWGVALISIGSVFIASSPLMGVQVLMISTGLLLWVTGYILMRKGKERT